MNTASRHQGWMLLLLAALAPGGCAGAGVGVEPASQATTCQSVTAIEGQYTCAGECVKNAGGTRTVTPVSGETDTIARVAGAREGLYQVAITGSNNFRELEIGALAGCTLRTATADVSDAVYPVLEEYLFEAGPDGRARAFTKIVRNPTPEHFKACSIRCERSQP
jgi:hypothetical protein